MNTRLIVLITGASTGFGRLTAEALVQKGYVVYASMREVEGRNAAHATALRTAVKGAPGRLEILELDVTSEDSVNRAVQKLVDQEGRLDVVYNNAGIFGLGFAEAHSVGLLQKIFDVNVFGVHRVNRAVLPQMRKQGGGLILYTSSVVGRVVFPFTSAYVASKFGVEGLAEAYRYELNALGIDSVIIEPGAFATGIDQKGLLADDAARATGYKALQQEFDGFTSALGAMLTDPNGQKPTDVAEAVVKLMETPAGQRPFRVVVDQMGYGVPPLNQLTEQMQAQIFGAMGLDHLTKLKA